MPLLAAVFFAVLTNDTHPDKAPHLWLESIDSHEALEWVEAQNLISRDRYAETPLFTELQGKALEMLDLVNNYGNPNFR